MDEEQLERFNRFMEKFKDRHPRWFGVMAAPKEPGPQAPPDRKTLASIGDSDEEPEVAEDEGPEVVGEAE